MKKSILLSLVGALIFATSSVHGHGVLVEPPVRVGMGKTPANNNRGKKLVGETQFRNEPGNGPNSGCGNQQSTGNPGPGEPTVTWTAGQQAKVCWEITLQHLEQAGLRSPGVRVSLAYNNNERFDANVLLKDLDAGPNGIYCSTITVPPGKTTNAGILQWSWVSLPDGGAYVGCADVRILAPTNVEGCSTSMWLGAVNNCAAGNGLFDLSPMINNHPGGSNAINRVCGNGRNGGNWAQVNPSHGGYAPALTTAKGDIKHGGVISRRLGPATNCPANAKTPPKLAPQQGGGQPTTQPPNNPVTTQPAVTTAPTPKPCLQPGQCSCAPGVVTKLGLPDSNGAPLAYPITVSQAMTPGQKITVPCEQSNKGYAAAKSTHSGFVIACSANTGKLYLFGGSCAAYAKCASIQNNPGPVCSTGRYNPNAANEPCGSSTCKVADSGTCCIGSPPIDNTGGGNNNGASGSCQPNGCYGLTPYTSSTGVCSGLMSGGATSITPNGLCNRMPRSTAYYRMSCNGNTAVGKFGCDATCTTCANEKFEINTLTEVNRCATKFSNCIAASPGDCLSQDLYISRQCVADGASSLAISAVAAGVVIAGVL